LYSPDKDDALFGAKEMIMRKLILAMMALTAAGAATLTTSAPAAAQDYPWCLSGRDTGYPGECSYTTYNQCMASAFGRYAYCSINPRVAFGQQAPRGRRYYPYDYYR
jgi:hypothetical protein